MGIGILSSIDLYEIKSCANSRLMKKINVIDKKINDIENAIDDNIYSQSAISNPVKSSAQSIFFQYSTQHPVVDNWLSSENECTDGVDDGKISFWSKAGNLLEGVAKTLIGGAKNFLSDPKKVAKAALVGAGLFVLASTSPVGMAIAATIGFIGGVKLLSNGLKTIFNGVQKAESATTDKDAKDAWEQIGNGGFKVGFGLFLINKGCSKFKECLEMPDPSGAEFTECETEDIIKEAGKAVINPANYADEQ